MIDKNISHFRITEKLGEGGMGVVYKAQDRKLDRTVALKFLPQSLTPTKEGRRRLIREAKSAAALNHPNICTIHNIDEHDGNQFIVMEYIEGETLREKIEEGDLSIETALDYAARIADALAKAHQNDIIHRDIKPENIMVNTDGHIKVMDFGLAKLKHTRDITKTGSTVGTLSYMSPEQIQGKQVDQRSDLFSFGIVLYEILTAQKPFRGEHEAAMTYAVVNEEPVSLQRYLPEAPEDLVSLTSRLLAKEPEKRMGDAAKVSGLLKKIRNSADVFVPQNQKESMNEVKQQKSGGSSSDSTILPDLNVWEKFIGRFGLAGIAGTVILVLFLGWWFAGGNVSEINTTTPPDGSESEIADHSIAVLPFEVSGSGAEEWKDGMVTALGLNLDGAAGLRSVADRTIFAAWKQEGRPNDIGTSEAIDIAREIGARYAVVGSAVQLGQDLRFGVEVREVTSGERLGQVEVRGAPDSVTVLTNEITRQILGVLLKQGEEAIPSVNIESITTQSLPALKSYLEGERHYRAGEYEDAIDNYKKSLEDDSSFALAYARISFSHGWLAEFEDANHFLNRAYDLSDRLPDRERWLIEARHLWGIQGNKFAALDNLWELSETYDNDPRVWYELGELLFHGVVPPGWPEAERAFQRAIELDPDHAPYHHHYVELAFGYHRDSLLAAERTKAHPDGASKQHYLLSLDLIFGNQNQRQRALRRLENISIPDYNVYTSTLAHPSDSDLREMVYNSLQNREDYKEGALLVEIILNDFMQGQIKQVIADINKLGEVAPAGWLALMESLKLPVPDSSARQYLEPDNLPADPTMPQLKSSIIYLIEQDRAEEADELFDHIKAARDTTENPRTIEALIKELQGYRAWKAGNLSEAEIYMGRANESSFPGAIWRGDLYRELGKLKQSEEWYLAGWRDPLAHERLGKLYEEMDSPDKAADAYSRFIEAWKNADPEVQDRVEQARQRLQQLNVSEGGTSEEEIDIEE